MDYYRLGSKKIHLREKNLKRIGQGVDGNVYRFKNEAVKIYKTVPDKIGMSEDTCSFLTGLSTRQIILPKKVLYKNNQYNGFSMRLITKKGFENKIINLESPYFIRNVQILESDIEVLSANKILLNDVKPSNIIFNGDLFLLDPTCSRLEDLTKEDLKKLNSYQLHLLISELITSEMRKGNYENRQISNVKELLQLKEVEKPSSIFFGDLLKDEDNIKKMIKKIS